VLSSRIALVANLVGLAGIYGLMMKFVGTVAPDSWSDTTRQAVAIGLTISVIVLVIAVVISKVMKDYNQNVGRMQRQLLETEEQLLRAERDSGLRSTRIMQQRAVEALSILFGYRIEKLHYHFSIYSTDNSENGSADMLQQVGFKCNRRALSSWTRAISSTLVTRFEDSQNAALTSCDKKFRVTMNSTLRNIGVKKVKVETFQFKPFIRANDGIVTLQFEEEHGGGAFLTDRTSNPTRNFDFISVQPLEPVAGVELIVQFHGFDPEISVEVVRGSEEEPMARELLEAEEALTIDKEGKHRVARLALAYPIMGVKYKLKWEWKAKPTLALPPPDPKEEAVSKKTASA
jgi:hypothetical protein